MLLDAGTRGTGFIVTTSGYPVYSETLELERSER
jgi:hypothetical protein